MFANINLISLVLSLPVILLALSVHEASHGFVAYKLGDPTARNLGRLTLNPIKHINIWGFVCMLFFRFGWANPVPINTRNFKKPRRDMALSAAAGPASNILSAILFALLLRVDLLCMEHFFTEDTYLAIERMNGYAVEVGMGFNMMCVLTYMLYIGVILNIGLAVFNLIPIPPFDGSRIAYVFLPPKWYFKVMKYEQYIMIAILALLFLTPFGDWIPMAASWLSELVMKLFGIFRNPIPTLHLNVALQYLTSSIF